MMLFALLRRLALSLVTLLLLSIIVFGGAQVLPGDVGRSILGPLADQRAVDVLNHELGVDRPVLVQYWDWISGFVVGDMGMSLTLRRPIAPFIGAALLNSLKLAAVAFVIVVPLSLFAGVMAARHVGKPLDRLISIVGRDDPGRQLLAQTALAGVDLDRVIRSDAPTGLYAATLDRHGKLIIAVAAMAILEQLTPERLQRYRRRIATADLVVADSNLPSAALDWLIDLAATRGVRLG